MSERLAHFPEPGFDSRVRTLFSIDHLVFTMLFIFVKRMYIKRGAPLPRALAIPKLFGRAPTALHLRSYISMFICVFIEG